MQLATNRQELEQAFRLRFQIFNLELNEGLDEAYVDGIDRDCFDDVCEHLVVVDESKGDVVGTYRMQTGRAAASAYGYYSEQEFDFSPYEPVRDQILELGRACVHRDHRNLEVLSLLWKGIGRFAAASGCRYLLGCSSLTSQDPAQGWSAYEKLSGFLVEPEFRTLPKHDFQMPKCAANEVKVPKLLRTYLALGAKICGPPAIDREFKTIDFLTLLDLEKLSSAARVRYLGRD